MLVHDSISEILAMGLDFLFVCTPIDTIGDVFGEISNSLHESPQLKKGLIISDIASVKRYPLDLAVAAGIGECYVGTHPMYGTEKTGFENSNATMGDHSVWAVCNNEAIASTDKAQKMFDFIKLHLNGNPIFTNAKEHDQAVALSSHIPHVLAYELAGLISEESAYAKLAKSLNAGSFHGATRVAHANTQMFSGMLLQNRAEIAPLLDKCIADLTELAEVLKDDNPYKLSKSIHHFIARSDEFRAQDDSPALHRHDADGWVKCGCGKEHWGKNGAAGLFLVRFDEGSQKITHILLQHRAYWSAEGGTWGTPGGAISFKEDPIAGAIREAEEEAGVEAEDVEVLESIVRDHGAWRFTNVLAREKSGHKITPHANDQESLEVRWVSIEEVGALSLMSAFGREIDELLAHTQRLLTAPKSS
jgi:prephenate dehydrogenase/8-oxo-dGTP pyrophosphatase MutT (NUDIX family)